jgi:hypothetical protein
VNSSVSAAILQWDRFAILGSPRIATPGNAMNHLKNAMPCLCRYSRIIRHRRPLISLPDNNDLFESSYSVLWQLMLTDRKP